MSATIYPAARICADFISRALSASQNNSRPLFVGFQGPQGCGKTTLTSQTKAALQALPTPINAVVFSIDDLYLPYSGLTELARAHPNNALLNGRGQPGTHDPVLGNNILEQLAHINEKGGEVNLPMFDKSAYGGYGDRSEEVVVPLEDEELKRRYGSPADTTGGAGSRSAPPLHPQKHVLFRFPGFHMGVLILWLEQLQLVPENLHYVFEWRLQQEHAMKLENGGRGMTDEQVH
ncbi:hypothetical protein FRC06_003597, partial [Ceratobasidium sp. 370]